MQSVFLQGTKLLKIPTSDVFAVLHNEKRLEILIPGCRYIEKTEYKKTVSEILVNLDDRECTFLSEHWASNVEPNSRIMLSLSGNGGPAGTFKANLDMMIKSEKNNTSFSYTVNATFYWKSIVFKKSTVEDTVIRLIGNFLDNLQQQYPQDAENPFDPLLAIKKIISRFCK
tara:strand:- start:10 stop:522 length:513 start_codon:yes stop_codon:yes gene_type:complete